MADSREDHEMSNVQVAEEFGSAPLRSRQKEWISEHPLGTFFLLAYAFSWSCWLISYVLGGAAGVAFFKETHGTTDIAIGLTYLVAAILVVMLTRGRLGFDARTR